MVGSVGDEVLALRARVSVLEDEKKKMSEQVQNTSGLLNWQTNQVRNVQLKNKDLEKTIASVHTQLQAVGDQVKAEQANNSSLRAKVTSLVKDKQDSHDQFAIMQKQIRDLTIAVHHGLPYKIMKSEARVMERVEEIEVVDEVDLRVAMRDVLQEAEEKDRKRVETLIQRVSMQFDTRIEKLFTDAGRRYRIVIMRGLQPFSHLPPPPPSPPPPTIKSIQAVTYARH